MTEIVPFVSRQQLALLRVVKATPLMRAYHISIEARRLLGHKDPKKTAGNGFNSIKGLLARGMVTFERGRILGSSKEAMLYSITPLGRQVLEANKNVELRKEDNDHTDSVL